jgi:hypothetical protein
MVPQLMETHRMVLEGIREAAAHFQAMQNQAIRREHERVMLAVAQEDAQRQRHAQLVEMMSSLHNPGQSITQQMEHHWNVWNHRTLVQQVFTNDPQHMGIPSPGPPTLDDEMVQAAPKRPGDDGGAGGAKRLKAVVERPAEVVANETARHVVALANAAHAAAAAEHPTPEDAAIMAVGHAPYGPGFKPPVRLQAKQLAPYTRAHSEAAAKVAREVIARELMTKMTPGKKKPSEAAATAAAAEAENDQSGGKPKLGKFAKSVAKARAKARSRPTPGRAQAVEAFEKAKVEKTATKTATPRKVVRTISKTPRSAKVK